MSERGKDPETVKYVLQIFFSGVVPFALFVLAGRAGHDGISLSTVNTLFKHFEILAFLVVGVTSLFGYAYLVGKEINSSKKVCYTLAQIICLLTSVNAFAYAWTINRWIEIAAGDYTAPHAETIDIFYSLIDISSAVNQFLVIQLIFVTFFRRWIIPLSTRFRMAPPIGKVLIDKGYITEAQLKEALKEQEKEGEEK